mgnify:CR=1 FL=1
MFEILVNKNNVCILKYYDTYYCFSYDKMLASYSKAHGILIYTENIESETNRKHLKMFKNVLDNMKWLCYNIIKQIDFGGNENDT